MSVILIGPSGVGKTTLLTAMLHQGAAQLTLTPRLETQTQLELLEQQFLSIHQQPNFTPVVPLFAPTSATHGYSFEFKSLELIIEDTAGSQFDDNEFMHALEPKSVIITVIDAAALMEIQPQPQVNTLLTLLQTVCAPPQKRLMIIVLTKAETWLKTPQSSQQLQHRFEHHYQPLLAWLETTPYLVAMYLPVNTLGCVEFSHVSGYGDQRQLVFVKKANLSCQPRRIEQVLCYSLVFMIKHYQPRPRLWEKLGFAQHTSQLQQWGQKLMAQHCDRQVILYGNRVLIE